MAACPNPITAQFINFMIMKSTNASTGPPCARSMNSTQLKNTSAWVRRKAASSINTTTKILINARIDQPSALMNKSMMKSIMFARVKWNTVHKLTNTTMKMLNSVKIPHILLPLTMEIFSTNPRTSANTKNSTRRWEGREEPKICSIAQPPLPSTTTTQTPASSAPRIPLYLICRSPSAQTAKPAALTYLIIVNVHPDVFLSIILQLYLCINHDQSYSCCYWISSYSYFIY